MYSSIRKYRLTSGDMDQVVSRIRETFVDQLKEQSWFGGYYVVVDGETLSTITVGSDRDGVEGSTQMAAEFVQKELSDVDLERLDSSTGEVVIEAGADG